MTRVIEIDESELPSTCFVVVKFKLLRRGEERGAKAMDMWICDSHAEAREAILNNAASMPRRNRDLFWTRPNWTVVSKKGPWTWHIIPRRDGKWTVDKDWGPLEFEYQS
jgi:hypothetical protein